MGMFLNRRHVSGLVLSDVGSTIRLRYRGACRLLRNKMRRTQLAVLSRRPEVRRLVRSHQISGDAWGDTRLDAGI